MSDWAPCLMVSIHGTWPEAEAAKRRVEALLQTESLPGSVLVDAYDLTRSCVFVEATTKEEIVKVQKALKLAGFL